MNNCCNNGCCEDTAFNDDYCYEGIARVGHQAPNFTAKAYYKKDFHEVSLNEHKGKWRIVFFYPLDFTFVCPTEIKELSAKASKLREMNCEPYLVSIDSEFCHKAWCEHSLGELDVPMVADTTHEISQMYGVENENGVAIRGTFIINPEGVIKSAIINDTEVGRNVDEMIRTLEAFQTGDLCPATWKKGEKTLGKA